MSERKPLTLARGIWLLPRPLLRMGSPRRLITLAYHMVSDRNLPHVRPLYPYKTPAQFEADLHQIRQHWHPLSNEEVTAYSETGASLPPRSVNVTFDDGFAECFTVVRPLLKKYEVAATFFVVGSTIDNRAMIFPNEVALSLDCLDRLPTDEGQEAVERLCTVLGWSCQTLHQLRRRVKAISFAERKLARRCCDLLGIDIDRFLAEESPHMTREQLIEMHQDGFTIGAHTMHHPELWLIPADAVEREIVESCAIVRDITGQTQVPLAFPFNGLKLDRDFLASVRARNPMVGLLYDTNNLMRDRAFIVNRINADPPCGARGSSNLPFLIRRAHALEPLRRVKRWRKR